MKLNSIVTLITIFLGVFLSKSLAQTVDKVKLDELFRHLANNNKAIGTVAISKGGKELYTRNFGQGNLKIPVDSNGIVTYHVGSITKMLTATMIYQLADLGKIDLSDNLSKYFPDLPNANKIDLNHLLSHSSGLRDYLTKQDSLSKWLIQPRKQKEILMEIKRQGVKFQPGDSVMYSNTGYYLLALILENTYKKPYRYILQKQIVDPLQLNSTYSMPKKVKSDSAVKPYRFEKEWQEITDLHFANVIGVGDVVSTPSELNKVTYALFNQGLVKGASLEKMKGMPRKSFGAGMMQIPYFGKILYGHGGDTFGTHSLTLFNPIDSLTISICLNGQVFSSNNLAIAVLDNIYLKESTLPNFKNYVVDVATMDKYAGDYISESIPLKLKIFRDKNKLKAQANGQSAFELEPLDKDKFGRSAIGLQIEFRTDENKLIFMQRGKKIILTKSEAAER